MRPSVDFDTLREIVKHPDLKDQKIPFLIILNKQDKDGAYSKNDLKEFLKIDSLKAMTKMRIGVREAKGKEGVGFAECLSFFIDHLI